MAFNYGQRMNAVVSVMSIAVVTSGLVVAVWISGCMDNNAEEQYDMRLFQQDMVSYHQRVDANLPAGLIYFIGDSHIQGLANQAVYTGSVNYGIGSDTSKGVLRRIDRYRSLKSAKAVFLAVGFNDLKLYEADEVLVNLNRIVKKLPQGIPIFINEIFPANIDKLGHYRNQRASQLNAQIGQVCARYEHVHCVRVYDALVGSDGSLDPLFDSGDGVHLSPAGYEQWIKMIRRALRSQGLLNG